MSLLRRGQGELGLHDVEEASELRPVSLRGEAVILLVVIGLYLKIQQIERPPRPPDE